MLVGMIEQKMERYESALARLRDAFVPVRGDVPLSMWDASVSDAVSIGANYPAVLALVVATRRLQDAPASGPSNGGEVRMVVTRHYGRRGVHSLMPGTDLLTPGPSHPSMTAGLSATFGWVGPGLNEMRRKDRPLARGFWFAIPLRSRETSASGQWIRGGETELDAARRRSRWRAEACEGMLAAFIGAEEFISDFNSSDSAMIHVRLFPASPVPQGAEPLNIGGAVPARPAFSSDVEMRWYGRRWTARAVSTPEFEAGSLDYRAYLVWAFGVVLSLGGAAMLVRQVRILERESMLAGELEEALRRQERLGRDLHDGALQSLYGVGLGLRRVHRMIERDPAAARDQLAETGTVLQSVVHELRSHILDGTAVECPSVPLREALEGVLSQLRSGTDAQIESNVDPGVDVLLTPAMTLEILNLLREALSNSVRHSRARRIVVAVRHPGDGLVQVEVEDDGVGFDPLSTRKPGRGLRNLAARIEDIGATHAWTTPPGGGSRLEVRIPVAANPERQDR